MLCRRFLIAAVLVVACVGTRLTIPPAFGQEQPASSEGTAATAEKASAAAPAEVFVYADAAPLRIQLIKIRSDWSQGKDPEGTKKALEALLENETLRDEIRENLLGSASQILFPEGYLAVYKPQEFAASLAWMKERDLMQTVAESEPIANHQRPDWTRHYTNGCSARVFATEDMIPMTTLGTDDVPPFTKRTYGVEWIFLSWKVFEEDHTSTKEIAFRLAQAQQRVDRLHGDSGEVVSMDYYGGGGFDGTCPPDQVSVFHGFFNSPAIRQYTREEGWEPLLVIVPAGQKQIEVKTPKLARLTSLQRIGKGNLLPPRTAAVRKEEESKPEEPQIKIFHLAHARADQMVAILRQLFPEITMSGDERTNSLVAQGEQRRLEVAEAVIQKLDEKPSQKQEPPLDEASRRHILETASTDFASAEAEIQSIVNSIAGDPDKKKSEQLRTRLTGLVAQAFDLRQKLQRAEVGLLREKVGIVERRLAQRDTLRKEIIDRRVEELLGSGQAAESQRPTPAKAVPARSPEDAAEKVSSVNKPPFPAIPLSLSAVEKIRSQTRQERFAAWARGYEGQEARNPWPAELSKSFHAAVRAVGGSDLPPNFRIEYQNYIRKHAPELDTIVNRRRPKQPQSTPPEMEGIVEWNETDYARIQSTFYWVTRPLTPQVRLAQEDLWCYEAILNSIAKVNKNATEASYPDVPIRRIEALKIGKAAIQTVSKTTAGSPDNLLAGRYVDTSGKPLPPGEVLTPEFNILPVQLDLHLKEEALQELEQQLSKCDMPVTIARTFVGTSEIGGKTAAGPGGRNKYVFVTFRGFIPIYNPPDESKLTDAPVAVDFKNTPWPDVYRWLAETFQLEVLPGEPMPEGTCTLSSPPAPRNQVLDLVDRALQAQGFSLKTDNPGPGKAVVAMMPGESVRRSVVNTREAITKWKKVLQDEEASSDEGVRAIAQQRLEAAEHDLEESRSVIKRDLAKVAGDHQWHAKNVTAGQRKLDSLQTLQAKGYVDPAELKQLKKSIKSSQDAAMYGHAWLVGLRKAAEAAGLTPAEIKEAEAAPPAPPEQLGIIPTFPLQFDQKPWKDVLQWFAETGGYRLRIMDPISEDQTFTYHSPEPVTLDQAFEILRNALSNLGYRFYETRGSSGQASLSLQATEAESMRQKLAGLQSEVARWQKALADETTPRSDEEIATLENRLKSARAEASRFSRALLQRIQFYGHSLSSTERQAAAARRKWEDLKRLQPTGDATEAEVAAAQEAFERSDKAYQSRRIQVDQLRKVAADLGLSVPEAQSSEDNTPPPQAAPAKPPLSPIGPAAAPATPRPTLPLRSPEEFQRLASEVRQSIERLEIRVGTKGDYEGLQNDLRSARERLTLIQAEFATQVQAIESEVRKAELEYSVAESEWRTVDEAVQRVPDSYSKNDVNNYRATSEVAKARLEQTKALLELYRKAGETVDLKAEGTANATPDAAPRPHAAVTAPLAGVETTTFRTPEQFQKTLHEARRQTAYTQKTVDELPARREELGKRYESELANAKQELATAQQLQELVEAEYAAQIQLFKTALEAAESKLKAAAETLARMSHHID